MPVFTLYVITDEWLLGTYFCDLWLCLDYTVSNASVCSLLLISFDRYFSITRPLSYRANRTTRKVVILIALSWIISVIMWSPFIIGKPIILTELFREIFFNWLKTITILKGWPYFYGGRLIKDNECKVQFLRSSQYLTLITAFIAFYLPVTIICILYFQIWRVTKRRQLELRNLQCQKYSTRINKKIDIEAKKTAEDCISQTLVPQQNYETINGKRMPKFLRWFSFSCFHQNGSDEAINNRFKYKISYRSQTCKYCNGGSSDADDQAKQDLLRKVSKDKLSEGSELKCLKCNRNMSESNIMSIDDFSNSANKSKCLNNMMLCELV